MLANLDREMYRSTGGGHKDDFTTFTAAGTTTDVIAGDSDKEITVDRMLVTAGAAAVKAQLYDGATAMGPQLGVAANLTDAVDLIIPFDAGAGVDLVVTGGACTVYLDYHRNQAGQ